MELLKGLVLSVGADRSDVEVLLSAGYQECVRFARSVRGEIPVGRHIELIDGYKGRTRTYVGTAEAKPAKKRRGRPPGSKNKPKPAPEE